MRDGPEETFHIGTLLASGHWMLISEMTSSSTVLHVRHHFDCIANSIRLGWQIDYDLSAANISKVTET